MANTKLTLSQKTLRKELKNEALADGVQILNLNDKTVMVFKDKGNTVEFALAVKSQDEQKFRLKVGEYYALDRFYSGQTVKMAKLEFQLMCEYVWGAYPI